MFSSLRERGEKKVTEKEKMVSVFCLWSLQTWFLRFRACFEETMVGKHDWAGLGNPVERLRTATRGFGRLRLCESPFYIHYNATTLFVCVRACAIIGLVLLDPNPTHPVGSGQE